MILPCTPVVVCDGAVASAWEITLTADVQIVVCRNLRPGALYAWTIRQDAVGHHAWPWSGLFVNPAAVPPDASTALNQLCFAGPDGRLYPCPNGQITKG